MDYTTLISVGQLQALMTQRQPLRVFDCSFDLMQPHAGEEQYLASHIPGAVYAHLDKALSARHGVLPPRLSGAQLPGVRHPGRPTPQASQGTPATSARHSLPRLLRDTTR